MAVIAKQRYKLDIAPKGGWVIVYASQHDNGAREIEFEITNQGNAFSIPASINVSVQGIKSNKSYFSHSCSYSGNIVTMALADDMTDVIGKAICVLKFTNQSNQKLATAKFVLNVDTDSSSEGIIIDTEAEEIFNQMLNDIRAQAASISADIAELQSMVGSPLVASTASEMADHNKIYVYTGSESGYTNGNWYYWNGSAWTSGGVYNSTAFETDKTLSVEEMPADAKAAGDRIGKLKSALSAFESNEKETIQLLKLVYVQNGYIDDNGAFQSPLSASHKIVSMDASKLRYVSFNTSTALGSNASFAVLKDSANNIVQVLRSSTIGLKEFNIAPQSGYVLYISFYNYATNPNPYYSVIQVIDYDDIAESYNLVRYSVQTLTESEKTQARTNIDACNKDIDIVIANNVKMIELSSMDYVQNGYIDGSGSFVSPTSASHKIVSIDASKIRYLQFQTAVQYTNSFSFGVIKDSDDNIIQIFKFDNTTNLRIFEITPSEGNTLYVSWFNFATIPNPNYSSFGIKDYESIINVYETEVKEIAQEITDSAVNKIKYYDCVQKPFVFTNKKLWFFGDSITYGYIGASGGVPAHQASNQYPKLFSEAVGAQSYVNWGVSGSTLADTYTTISTHPLSCDFVFVAGGVNDWQTGVTEATLIQTVTNICEHLKNNFNGTVIFITPINESGRVPVVTPMQTLQNVRNIITRIALAYGFSVVQGWRFPFPTKHDTTEYKTVMFQDDIHPTELGYSMYAQALRGALC